jgi:hypothetical protein
MDKRRRRGVEKRRRIRKGMDRELKSRKRRRWERLEEKGREGKLGK